jgi:hypothetical protein
VHEGVVGHGFALSKFDAFVGVKASSELVGVSNVEDTPVKFDIDANG